MKVTIIALAALLPLTAAVPAEAAARAIPKNFLLHEKDVAYDKAHNDPDDYADPEEMWWTDKKKNQWLAVGPCDTSATGERRDPKAGRDDRLDARKVTFQSQEYVNSVEQLILYRSEKAARHAMTEFRRGWEKCRGRSSDTYGDYRRTLTKVRLGDFAWRTSARAGISGEGDDAVIVRRANAVLVYLTKGSGKPKAANFRKVTAEAGKMLRKVCVIASC